MKKLIFTLLLVGCSSVVPPEPTVFREAGNPIPGYDVLGLAMQDAAMIGEEQRPYSVVGVLEDAFGKVLPKLRQVESYGKTAAFRVHLRDGTCVRNRVCAPGTPPLNDLNYLASIATPFSDLALQTGIPCYMSPVLEHDEKNPAVVQSWIDTIKAAAPGCIPVISAFTGVYLPGILQERHGSKAQGDIISGDGTSNFDLAPSWEDGSRGFALKWVNRMNLRTSGEKVFITPKKRVAKLTRSEMQQLTLMMQDPQPIPSFSSCPNARVLNSPEVWKTRSEDYNGKDVRENKAVLIIKGVYSKGFNIYRPDGKLVACLKYYGPYAGLSGYYRYYIGNCSGEDPVQLYNKAGQEWVCLKNGSTQIAVSAIRRSGSFR